ncbi:hypothetical protein AAG906_011216 [Vitis piasezkii]
MIDIPVDATIRPLLIESRSAPVYCCLIDDTELDDGLPWYHDIYHFLRLNIHGDFIHVPPSELHALTSPWSFLVWGIDIIGNISPKYFSDHEFILVAIDYFPKWLNLLDERRLRAVEHVRTYQRKMTHAFKKWVKPRPLQIGDLPTNVDQLKRSPLVYAHIVWESYESWTYNYLRCIDSRIITLVKYRLDLLYVPIESFLSYHDRWDALVVILGDLLQSTLLGRGMFIHIDGHSLDDVCQDEPSTEHDLREHPLRLMESILDHFHGLRAVVARYTGARHSRIFNLAFRFVFSFWAFDDTIASRFRHSNPSSILSFGIQSHHHSQSRHSEPLSLLSFDIQSHHHSQFWHSEPSSFSILTFRAIIILDFGVQSHHRFSISATISIFSLVFRAIIVLSFSVQSHHHFLVLAFRAIIASLVRHSESSSFSVSVFRVIIASLVRRLEPSSLLQFWCSEPPFLLSLGIPGHHLFTAWHSEPSSFQFRCSELHHHSQFRGLEPPLLLSFGNHHRFSNSTFKAIIILSFGVQSHHRFSVSTFRAIITSQFWHSEPSSFSVLTFRAIIILNFGVQSHHRFFSFGSHHHSWFRRLEPSSFSVSAFRAIIAFQFWRSKSSLLLSFGFQHSEPSSFSISAFRAIVASQFRHSEPSSLAFITIVHIQVFRAIVHIQVFRAIVHIQAFGAIIHIQAFRAIISP